VGCPHLQQRWQTGTPSIAAVSTIHRDQRPNWTVLPIRDRVSDPDLESQTSKKAVDMSDCLELATTQMLPARRNRDRWAESRIASSIASPVVGILPDEKRGTLTSLR
jgi:hypothetical protein